MFTAVKNNFKDQGISTSLVMNVLKNDGPFKLFEKAYNYTIRVTFLLLPMRLKLLAARKINKFKSDDVTEIINYSFNVLGGFIRPVQIRDEFHDYLTLFKDKQPKTILEIGTDKGGSLFSLCKLAPHDAMIISLDLPDGDERGGYPKWKDSIYMMFKKDNQRLLLLRGDSHSEEMLKQVQEVLNGRKFDFVFIDGDHSYEGVKQDFEMYSPLVNDGGIITFHDIASQEAKEGVPLLWNEIKTKYEHSELIHDHKQSGFGIGCLIK